jgi:hypothetical protein
MIVYIFDALIPLICQAGSLIFGHIRKSENKKERSSTNNFKGSTNALALEDKKVTITSTFESSKDKLISRDVSYISNNNPQDLSF